jgi:hypothetical protein
LDLADQPRTRFTSWLASSGLNGWPVMREHGARFRNEIVTGVGGKQILVEDPAGNPIELFQPSIPEAKLSAAP